MPFGVGVPTKYKPEYCALVQEFMAKGYSLGAFAGHVGVARSSINNWMAANPEFAEAVDIAKARRLLEIESKAIGVMDGENNGRGASQMIMFALRNAGGEEWQENVKHDANVTITLESDSVKL